jgi:hypothetical protein
MTTTNQENIALNEIEINFMTGEKLHYNHYEETELESSGIYAVDIKRFIARNTDYNYYTLAIFKLGEEDEIEYEIDSPLVFCVISGTEPPKMFFNEQVIKYDAIDDEWEIHIINVDVDYVRYNIINKKHDKYNNLDCGDEVEIRRNSQHFRCYAINTDTKKPVMDFNVFGNGRMI